MKPVRRFGEVVKIEAASSAQALITVRYDGGSPVHSIATNEMSFLVSQSDAPKIRQRINITIEVNPLDL